MYSDAPYWRPPSRALSMVFQLETYGLEARFCGIWRATCPRHDIVGDVL